VVVLPVVANDDVIGVFELFSSRPYAFEERDIVALQRLAEMVQTALEQAEAVKRGVKEITKKEEPPVEPEPEPAIAAATPEVPAVAESAANLPEVQAKVETIEPEVAVAPESPAPEAASKPVTEPAPAVEKAPESVPGIASVAQEIAVPEAAKVSESFARVEAVAPILPEGVALHFKIGKCASCGFPVSEGRTICIDCERKAAKPEVRAEEVENSSEDEEAGWFSRHKLAVVAIILFVIAIAAAAIFYLR
jgi:hypothetical protein